MSSQYLDFTEAEYQELDTFTFQETIQKSESVRFYTLNEQEVDAYEKLLPKGRMTNVQRNVLKDEVSKMHDLYMEYVEETPTDYQVRSVSYGKHFDWIFPVYANKSRKRYLYNKEWKPLFLDDARFQGGFYTRMVTALPKPYASSDEGVNYPIENITTFLDTTGKKPFRALPAFQSSKQLVHEDRTVEILPYTVSGTKDDVHFVGYYIEKRPFDIPNPLPDHPFLSSNEPTFFESTAPIQDVVPSIDAILTHAVPTTTDPYTEGNKYVKLYDIRLSDIPWSSWKSRFPPVDSEFMPREKVVIPFIERDTYAPSDKIVETYKSPYYPGTSTREWLMKQDDGGLFVIKALQSTVINNGSVSNLPILGPVPEYPSTTAEECALMGLKFHEFTIKGLLRRSWKINKDKDDIRVTCIPLEFVKQERARAGYDNRLPWQETTGLDIITEYLKLLRSYRIVVPEKKEEPIAITPAKPDSVLYIEVTTILQDRKRNDRDKLKDIQALLQEAILSNEIYTDAKGDKVLCSHTLAILSGDMEEDRQTFYDKWTEPRDGHRICRFCGQQVSEVDAVDQDEYDQNGFLIKQKEVIAGQKNVLSTTLSSYISNTSDLVHVFNQGDISESLCYQIISILQVMPNVNLLQQILTTGRFIITDKIRKDTVYNTFRGGIGIALAILILQSDPTLVPRRSFGPTPLKLTGYPRDISDPNEEKYTIIDALIYAIDKTFRGFPSALEGPTAPVIRTILSDPKKIRNNTVMALNNLFKAKPEIKTLLEKAKSTIGTSTTGIINVFLPDQIDPPQLGTIHEYKPCDTVTTSILSSDVPPRLRQPTIELRPGLRPSELRSKVTKSVSTREEVSIIEKAKIQERSNLAKTQASKQELFSMKIGVSSSYRTNLMVASNLSDKFLSPMPIENVDPKQIADDLRDIASGFLYEALTMIKNDPEKKTTLEKLRQRDASIYCLTADYDMEKKSVLSIRANERLTFVQRMGEMTDEQREITSELLKRGLASYIIKTKDRALFAIEQERINEQMRVIGEDVEETLEQLDAEDEEGVGKPQYIESEDDNLPNADGGDYGNLPAFNTDHDDAPQPNLWDNEND